MIETNIKSSKRIGGVFLAIAVLLCIFTVVFANKINAADEIQTIVTEYSNLWTGDITVKVGVPVKWYVNVPEGTTPIGCAATIKIPGLGWGTDTHNKEEGHLKLTEGQSFIYEFTPTETGDILFTCWMGSGCHHNYIHVTDDGNPPAENSKNDENTVYGVLICGNCKSAPPAIHTIGCTLMSSCQASGYGLIVPQSDKTYKFYKFDSEGDTYAYNTLSALREKGIANYLSVKVSGIVTEESGTYGYTYTNKSGEEVNDEYTYDGTITNISSIEYEENHEGFEANAVPLSVENVKISAISGQEYTGEEIKPDITVTDGDYTLRSKYDYIAEYSNNTEPGTAVVTIKGIGAFYNGETTVTFEIIQPIDNEPNNDDENPDSEPSASTDNPTNENPDNSTSEPSDSADNSTHQSSDNSVDDVLPDTNNSGNGSSGNTGADDSSAKSFVAQTDSTNNTVSENIPDTGDDRPIWILTAAVLSCAVLLTLRKKSSI